MEKDVLCKKFEKKKNKKMFRELLIGKGEDWKKSNEVELLRLDYNRYSYAICFLEYLPEVKGDVSEDFLRFKVCVYKTFPVNEPFGVFIKDLRIIDEKYYDFNKEGHRASFINLKEAMKKFDEEFMDSIPF